MRQAFSIFLPLLLATAAAFTPLQFSTFQKSNGCCLNSVIKGEDVDAETPDPGMGGVRLAQESAVKVFGTVKHKPGSADPKPMDLLRYTRLREVSEADISKYDGVKIVGFGMGKELYKDPGSGFENDITLAPLDAVRDATMGLGSTQDAEKVVINFLGGDDLQMMEVLDAIQQMVINLDVKTSTKIDFNSVSHNSVPLERAAITVIALTKKGSDGDSEEKLRGIDKPISEGELYFLDGKYFTVVEEDINNAVA